MAREELAGSLFQSGDFQVSSSSVSVPVVRVEKAKAFSLPIPGTTVSVLGTCSFPQPKRQRGRGIADHVLMHFTAGKAGTTRYLVVWVLLLVRQSKTH